MAIVTAHDNVEETRGSWGIHETRSNPTRSAAERRVQGLGDRYGHLAKTARVNARFEWGGGGVRTETKKAAIKKIREMVVSIPPRY